MQIIPNNLFKVPGTTMFKICQTILAVHQSMIEKLSTLLVTPQLVELKFHTTATDQHGSK